MLRTFRRSGLTMLSVLALLALSVGIVSAHAKYKSSVPAADSTVATAPAKVTVTFDNHDPIKLEGSVLQVTDAAGNAVDMSDTALDKADADRKTLAVSLKGGLANGAYTVNWKAVSSGDNSVGEGSFNFSVGEASTTAPSQLPRTGAGDTLPLIAVLLGAVLFITLGMALRRYPSR